VGPQAHRRGPSAMWGTWAGPAISRLHQMRRNLICQPGMRVHGGLLACACVPASVTRAPSPRDVPCRPEGRTSEPPCSLGFVWIRRDWSGLKCILGIEREISSYYTSIHLIPPQSTPIQDYPNKPLGVCTYSL
jgi:hypothetical protein